MNIKLGSRYVRHPKKAGKKYLIYQIIIPKELIKKLRWKKGNILEIKLGRDKKSLVIKEYEW